MRKLFFIAAASLTASVFGFTPTAYTNSYTECGVTYVQRGALGTKDYVVTNVDAQTVGRVQSVNGKTGTVVLGASDVGALHDNYTSLTNNSNFKAAVEKVSPPVVLPSKWALANVTNSMGGAVEATDIGAAGLSGVEDDFTVGGDLTVNGSLSAQNVKCDEGFWAYNWKYGYGSISKFGKDGLLYTVEFPSGGGTLALASDIQPVPSKWALANVTNATGGSVTAADVGARANNWMPTADNVGALPARKVNATLGGTHYEIDYNLYRGPRTIQGSVYNGMFEAACISFSKDFVSPFTSAVLTSYGLYDITFFTNMVEYKLSFPAKTGTLALASDIPSVSGQSGYLPVFNATGNGLIKAPAMIGANTTVEPASGLYITPEVSPVLTVPQVGIGAYLFGTSTTQLGMYSVGVGGNLKANMYGVAVGNQAKAGTTTGKYYGVAVGYNSQVSHSGAVSIGKNVQSHGDNTFNTVGTDLTSVYVGDSNLDTLVGTKITTAIASKPSYLDVTNTVNAVKSKFYDDTLQTEWTMRMVNGEMKLYATTNVNTSVLN